MTKRVKNTGRVENLTNAGKGRPPGVLNKATREAKALCNELVDDPTYLKKLKKRLLAGDLAPAVESMIWYYAKGKPKERVEFGADKSLAQLVLESINGKPDEPPNP